MISSPKIKEMGYLQVNIAVDHLTHSLPVHLKGQNFVKWEKSECF